MFRNDLDLIQKLVKCLSGIDLAVFDGREQALASLYQGVISQDALPCPSLHKDLDAELGKLRPGCIYEVCSLFQLQLILAYDQEDDRYLVVGPCLLDKPRGREIRAQLRELELSADIGDTVLHYLNTVPLIAYETYHLLGNLLVQALTNEDSPLPYQRISYDWSPEPYQAKLFIDQYAELTHIRRVELRYENSAALTEAVKCGNLSLAYRFLREMDSEGDAFARNPDPLRNRQNMCIILNTQLRYALEEVGVHPYLLDKASGDIGLRIEKLKSLDECNRVVSEAIRQYCELAQNHAYPTLSPFIHLTVTYIKSHLAENITVKDTAQSLLINPDYLSHKFHEEMGITFIDFINRERCAQATALLTHTAMQIQQISSIVGCNNTSYFARQFTRFYHMTPRDYRKKGIL